eukprot:scaffold27_cov355-Prasinococcus_capsulatus_cf.AAC.12
MQGRDGGRAARREAEPMIMMMEELVMLKAKRKGALMWRPGCRFERRRRALFGAGARARQKRGPSPPPKNRGWRCGPQCGGARARAAGGPSRATGPNPRPGAPPAFPCSAQAPAPHG